MGLDGGDNRVKKATGLDLDKENAILKQKNEFLNLDIEELSKKHEDSKKRE